MVCQTRSVFDAPQCTSARQTDFFCQTDGYNSASTVYLNLDVSTTSSAMPTMSASPARSTTSTTPATSAKSAPPATSATSAESVPSTTAVPSTSTPASSAMPSSSTTSSSIASSSVASSSLISSSRVSSPTASSATSKPDPAATSLTATTAAAPSQNSTSAAAAETPPSSSSTPAWIAGAVIGPLAVAALAGLAFWLVKRRALSRSGGNLTELGISSPGEDDSFGYSTMGEAAALNLLASKPYGQQRRTRASELGGDQPAAYAAAVPPLSEAPGEEFAVRELP
ncbi:hypothetical protein B0T24DRAFT_609431 [Lasiosphaeria ovina]|uniref:Uncharacterized protein n=1 Tax=Lasiosphaeria ovina TaxID=92902 RepID=A0AAE0NDD6_9PEZI|nr:hypothetical protein B0T24DRAFT_609431 [Lasiosphaeria ovina]